MYTWQTLLHYPHGANAGCDLAAGVAPMVARAHNTQRKSIYVDGMTGVKCPVNAGKIGQIYSFLFLIFPRQTVI